MKTKPITFLPVNEIALAELRAEIQGTREYLKALEMIVARHESKAIQSPMLPPPVGKRAIDVAYEILTKRGDAMPRSEIFAELESMGFQFTHDTLAQSMSRDERFSGVGRGHGAKWTTKEILAAKDVNNY